MRLRRYSTMEKRFRMVKSCHILHGTFVFEGRMFKLSEKTQRYNKFSIARKRCWCNVVKLTSNYILKA
jgi:hypothetical protein